MIHISDLNGNDFNFRYVLHSPSQSINHRGKRCPKLQCGFKNHVLDTASFMLQHQEWVILTTSNFFFQKKKIKQFSLPTMLFIQSSFNRCSLPTITATSANANQFTSTDCDICHSVYAYKLWHLLVTAIQSITQDCDSFVIQSTVMSVAVNRCNIKTQTTSMTQV